MGAQYLPVDTLEPVKSTPQGWPTTTRPIRTSKLSVILELLTDILLLTLSTLSLAFAIIVSQYDELSTVEYPQVTSRLTNIAKIGPSIFPILFAATLGRAAHSIFLWRLYRGDRIGILDLLADSTSLTATVTSQIRLRMLSLFGLTLIMVWSWSPVGGQASFRQLSIENRITSQKSNFSYMIHPDQTTLWDVSVVNALYASALMSPAKIKNSPQDIWGNIKIPMIEQYESTPSPDSDGWYARQEKSSPDNTTYSSLVGIPITGLNSSGFIDYSFNIETEYLYLHCPVIRKSVGIFNDTDKDQLRTAYNATGDTSVIFWDYKRLPFHNYTDDPVSFNFTYFDQSLILHCSLATAYVEVEVTCATEVSCEASRLRRSSLHHPPANYTKLDVFGPRIPLLTNEMDDSLKWIETYWDLFASIFVRAFNGQPTVNPVSSLYLLHPLDPYDWSNWDQNTNQGYQLRLNQLMNTIWTSIKGQNALTGGLSTTTAALGQPIPIEQNGFLANVSATTGTKSVQTSVIATHLPWTVALIIASMILIVASLVPPIIRTFIVHGPDFLPNISSLATQHNKYVPLPANGTYMSAWERAYFLKDVKVRFGDVESAAEHGRLAISSLENEKGPVVMRVVKGRAYE